MSEAETRNSTRGPGKKSRRKLHWTAKVGIVLLVLAGTLFLTARLVLKPFLIEQAAFALNRFVTHGDGVQIDNAEILGYYPPILKFSRIRARGKNSQDIEQDAIYAETGTVTLAIGNLTRLLSNFPDFNLSRYRAEIELIEFENCRLQFEMVSDSVTNFILFRPDPERFKQKDGRPEQILIRRMLLRDVDFKIVTQVPDMLGLDFETRVYDFMLDSVDMGLDISREKIHFGINTADGHTKFLSFDTIRILENTPIHIDGDLVLHKMDRERRANGETGTNLDLENLNFAAENLNLTLGGHYQVENQQKNYQLHLTSSIKKTKTTLDTFLKILPKSNADLIRQYDVQGELALDVLFEKPDPETIDPHIEISFESANASFFPRLGIFKGDQRVRDLYLSGKFSNGEKNNFETSFIEIDSVHARIGVPIDFTGRIRFDSIYDPQKIYLTTAFSIDTANFADVLTMVDSIPHYESGGQVQLSLSLQGLMGNLNLHDLEKIKYDGEINLIDLKFDSHVNNVPLNLDRLNGSLELVRNHIEVNRTNPLTGSVNHQNINLTGVIYNIAQYVVRQNEGLDPVWQSDFEIRLEDIGVKELADSVRSWLAERRRLLGLEPLPQGNKEGINLYYNINSLTDDVALKLLVVCRNLDLSQVLKDEHPQALTFDTFRMLLSLQDGLVEVPEITLVNSQDSILVTFNGLNPEPGAMELHSDVIFETRDLLKFVSHFGSTVELGKVHHAPISARGKLKLTALAWESETSDSLQLGVKLIDLDLKGSDPVFEVSDMSMHTILNQDQIRGKANQPLLVDSIRFKMDGNGLAGQVIIKDWEQEEFDLIMNALELPLATIHKYLHLITSPDSELEAALERIHSIDGSLEFQTHLTGSLDTLNVMKSLLYASQQGEIHFDNIGFEYDWISEERPLKFQEINGNFQFDPAGISFDHFSGYFGHSNFLLTGNGQDILPFIFDHQPLRAELEFDSEFLDLTDVVSNLGANPEIEETPVIERYAGRSLLDILYHADFKARANIDRTFFMVNHQQTVEIDNLVFSGNVKDQFLTIEPVQLDYAGGRLVGSLNADISDTTQIAIQTRFDVSSIPLENLRPLVWPGDPKQRPQFAGYLSLEGELRDTLNSGWSISDRTEARANRVWVKDFTISNLQSEPGIHWENLSSGTRFGLGTFLGLDKNIWLDPAPNGILFYDSLTLSGGIARFNEFQMQSNKAHIFAQGEYHLEGPGTHVKTRVLKARKQERLYGRPEYNHLVPKDFSRSQFRPFIKYKPYNERQRAQIAEEKGIPLEEVDQGYFKVHSNVGYTLFTLPRRVKFLFAKNPNKKLNLED